MAAVRCLVITGYGVNSDVESAFAARKAGADAVDIVHFSDLALGRVRPDAYNFIIFPGGFLDGDDLGAAQAAAQRWKYTKTPDGESLADALLRFISKGGLVLGVCNGFQLLVKLGLLPALDGAWFTRQVSLAHNASARYEDRWVRLRVDPESPCVFTKGLEFLYVPVRHGEGNLVPDSPQTLKRLQQERLIPVRYAHPESGEPTEEYPWNPNGSPLGIAGLCDPSGRIFGLMPHAEAYNHPTNHPGWTRGETAPLGLSIFENAVRHLRGV